MSFPVQSQNIAVAVRGLWALGVKGVNVTIPHKQAVFELMTCVSDEARLAHAINTISFDGATGEISGHNTDVDGWWTSIRDHLPSTNLTVAILGSGGAARAIATALALHAPGTQLHLVARTQRRLEDYERDFGAKLRVHSHGWAERHEVVRQSLLVVNATPIGLWPNVNESPIEGPDCFQAGQVVQDIVYRPLHTRMMEQASKQGAVVVDGLGMLVHQGALSAQFWTAERAPVDVMRAAAESFLLGGSDDGSAG